MLSEPIFFAVNHTLRLEIFFLRVIDKKEIQITLAGNSRETIVGNISRIRQMMQEQNSDFRRV